MSSRRRRRKRNTTQEVNASISTAYFKTEEDAAYAEALVSLLGRTNTILTGRDIQCALSEAVNIAATDGNIIYFNVGQVASLIRGLRIQRRVPDREEYDYAQASIRNGSWSLESFPDRAYYNYRSGQTYLWRKYREFPEIFELPYEQFVPALVRKEMGNSIRAFASIRGLNYHELSHCLYTPTANGSLRKAVGDICVEFYEAVSRYDKKVTSFFCEVAGLTPSETKAYLDSLESYEKSQAYRNADATTNLWKKVEYVKSLACDQFFWHKMWNTLEDQRIESLFVAKFPTARHFFTTIVLKYIANFKPNTIANLNRKTGSAYLLLYGRRYLSKKLRSTFREIFKNDYNLTDKDVEQVESLIDQFRGLSHFKNGADVTKAVGVVKEFGLWCLKHIEDTSQIPEPEGGFEHNSQNKTGKESGKRDSAEAQNRREKQEEDWESQEEDDDQYDFGDSDDDSSDDDSDDDSETSGDSENSDDDSDDSDGDSDGDSDDDADDSDEESETDTGNSQSRRHQDSQQGSSVTPSSTASAGSDVPKALRDALNQAEDAINEDAIRQIESLHDIVKKERVGRFFNTLYKPDGEIQPPVLYRSLSNAISTALSKLRSDRDNQWEKGSATGVVNVLRYAEARGTHTDFFDEWQEDGDERPDAELCVLLDLSSSMSSYSFATQLARLNRGKNQNWTDYDWSKETSNATEASCAMWAIKYACQRNDILCSVIGYSDNALPLYSVEDTVISGTIPVFNGISGTSPKDAITIARSVLEKSDAKHRILVSISDGDWAIDSQGIAQVDALRKLGVQTVFVQLPANAMPVKDSLVPTYSKAGWGWGTTKQGFYHHEHLLQAQDCSVLTKQIGAILLKAVNG